MGGRGRRQAKERIVHKKNTISVFVDTCDRTERGRMGTCVVAIVLVLLVGLCSNPVYGSAACVNNTRCSDCLAFVASYDLKGTQAATAGCVWCQETEAGGCFAADDIVAGCSDAGDRYEASCPNIVLANESILIGLNSTFDANTEQVLNLTTVNLWHHVKTFGGDGVSMVFSVSSPYSPGDVANQRIVDLLNGQYLLYFTPRIVGAMNVTVLVNGEQVGKLGANVNALSAPLVTSISYANDAGKLSLFFDSATDAGSHSSSEFNCSLLLNSNSSFGDGSYCVFTKDDQLDVYLGLDSVIRPGMYVTVLNETVKAKFGVSTFGVSSNSISVASSPLNPKVIISSPLSVRNGVVFEVSAAGSIAGRAATYEWNANCTSGGAAMESYVSSVGQNVTVSVDSSLLPAAGGNCTFIVNVTSFFGVSSTDSVVVGKSADAALPVVTVVGGFVQTASITATKVLAVFAVPDTAGDSLSFEWSVLPVVELDANSRTTSTLQILPFTLKAGSVYAFECSVADGASRVNSSISLTTLEEDLTGSLVGPEDVGVDQDYVVFDVSSAKDPLNETAVLSYTWNCTQLSGASCGFVLPSLTSTTMMVNVSTYLSAATSYIISCQISAESMGGRSPISLSKTLEVASGCLPSVAITPLGSPVIAGERLVVTGDARSCSGGTLSYFWSVVEGSQSISGSLAVLVIAEGVLEAGEVFTLRLRVTDSKAPGIDASADITISVVGKPSSGVCSISPTSGTASSTMFEISASGWVASSSAALPLTYSFGYGSVLLSAPSLTASLSTYLVEATSVFCTVTDAYGASVTKTAEVTVSATTDDVQTQLARLVVARTNADNSGDRDAAMAAAILTVELLNQNQDVQGYRSDLMVWTKAQLDEISLSARDVPSFASLIAGIVQLVSELDGTTADLALAAITNLVSSVFSTADANTLVGALESLTAFWRASITQTTALQSVGAVNSNSKVSDVQGVLIALAQQMIASLPCNSQSVSLSSPGIGLIGNRIPLSDAAGTNVPGPTGYYYRMPLFSSSAGCFDGALLTFSSNPHVLPNTTVVSPFVQLSAPGVTLSGDVVVRLPYGGEESDRACVWWDAASEQFRETGCRILSITSTYTECACDRVGEYAVKAIPGDPVTPPSSGDSNSLPSWAIALIIVFCVGIFLTALAMTVMIVVVVKTVQFGTTMTSNIFRRNRATTRVVKAKRHEQETINRLTMELS